MDIDNLKMAKYNDIIRHGKVEVPHHGGPKDADGNPRIETDFFFSTSPNGLGNLVEVKDDEEDEKILRRQLNSVGKLFVGNKNAAILAFTISNFLNSKEFKEIWWERIRKQGYGEGEKKDNGWRGWVEKVGKDGQPSESLETDVGFRVTHKKSTPTATSGCEETEEKKRACKERENASLVSIAYSDAEDVLFDYIKLLYPTGEREELPPPPGESCCWEEGDFIVKPTEKTCGFKLSPSNDNPSCSNAGERWEPGQTERCRANIKTMNLEFTKSNDTTVTDDDKGFLKKKHDNKTEGIDIARPPGGWEAAQKRAKEIIRYGIDDLGEACSKAVTDAVDQFTALRGGRKRRRRRKSKRKTKRKTKKRKSKRKTKRKTKKRRRRKSRR